MPHQAEFADIISLPYPKDAKDNENKVLDFMGEEYTPSGLTEQNRSRRESRGILKFSNTINPLSMP